VAGGLRLTLPAVAGRNDNTLAGRSGGGVVAVFYWNYVISVLIYFKNMKVP
jgi:hypothetical protein